jgi:hypothetical protein
VASQTATGTDSARASLSAHWQPESWHRDWATGNVTVTLRLGVGPPGLSESLAALRLALPVPEVALALAALVTGSTDDWQHW